MREDLDGGVQVLVVGAGPVGLTTAHELTRRGVRVRVVDQVAGPATTSRALATHARTLEVFDQMGVLDRVLPLGQRVEHFSLHRGGKRLVRFDTNYASLPTRFPFSLMVDQVITERVLREALAEAGVPVEWGVALESFEDDGESVRAVLRHAEGTVEELAVPWLVGADGGKSTVRKRLGLRLLGDSTQTWLNADVVLDADLPPDSNHLMHTDGGTLLLVPFPEPGKWRVVDTEDTTHIVDPGPVCARIAERLESALGTPVTVSDPTWVSVFTVQQRMIERMRVGRCFVAGDAAHVHSPASGQGMNTGIQDAYCLSWRLADVVRGFAGEELLDGYGAERVPIGKALLGSTRTATALVALRNALAPVALPVGLGILRRLGPLKRGIEQKMMRGFSGLALEYPDSPLSRPQPGRGGPRPGQRVGCSAETAAASAGWRELCAELTDPRWTVLVFGADATAVRERYSGALSVRTVGATGPRPLADPGDTVRAWFAASDGDYALIRPDGYLAASGPLTELTDVLSTCHLLPSEHASAR